MGEEKWCGSHNVKRSKTVDTKAVRNKLISVVYVATWAYVICYMILLPLRAMSGSLTLWKLGCMMMSVVRVIRKGNTDAHDVWQPCCHLGHTNLSGLHCPLSAWSSPGPKYTWGLYLGLWSYCSLGLSWCPWPVFPPKSLQMLWVWANTWGHVRIWESCCHQAIRIWVVCTTT